LRGSELWERCALIRLHAQPPVSEALPYPRCAMVRTSQSFAQRLMQIAPRVPRPSPQLVATSICTAEDACLHIVISRRGTAAMADYGIVFDIDGAPLVRC